jgi:hypothetical protein
MAGIRPDGVKVETLRELKGQLPSRYPFLSDSRRISVTKIKMAGVAGLEPVTSAVTGQRSNQLSYTPAKGEQTLENF